MNFLRRLALAGLATFAMLPGLARVFAADGESDNPREYLQSHYNLQALMQVEDRASGKLRLGSLANTGKMDDYLRALAKECKLYPDNFFSKTGVSYVVLCGDLNMGNAPISGIFMEQQKTLYMKYHWCQAGTRCRETFHTFHHELGHALQKAVWGNGHYDWPEWAALNPTGFHYGNGGSQELMADPEKNWGTWTTNQPGFLNAYSATAPWEDRSEIMAAMMNSRDRLALTPYYRRDTILQRKIDLMSGLLSGFCGPQQAKYSWEQAVVFLKTQPGASAKSMQSLSSTGPPASSALQPLSSVKVDLRKAIGCDLIDSSGNAASFDDLRGKKYFLLWFSASWCPKCRQFMPQFLDFYQNTKYHDKFEVIYVSSDHSESEMSSYLREMPWKAVRLNSNAESFLKTTYARGPGIPGLMLIDSEGRLLCLRKGFARNYEHGVDKTLDFLNQKLQAENSL